MAFVRPQIGESVLYRGFTILARKCSPCVLGEVDGQELPHFYATPGAVYLAGRRYADEKIKANETRKV
jgi:hypothetical protein